MVGGEDLREPEFAKSTRSEEGIAEITHALQVSILSQPSESVFDDFLGSPLVDSTGFERSMST